MPKQSENRDKSQAEKQTETHRDGDGKIYYHFLL